MQKLSVVYATRNEEENIARSIASVKNIADEIIVVDENSSDRTREIAQKYGASVSQEPHHDIFHITKQKALEKAKNEWILQLDADEVVTPELSKEIVSTIHVLPAGRQGLPFTVHNKLFVRHQKLIEDRDGKIGKTTGEIVGYFIPRRNMFLGKPLVHAGAYPDGVIRLLKNGKVRFPQKSVHEQIELDGEVSWLSNSLDHYDSPNLSRYLFRMNRYTDLYASEMRVQKIKRNILNFIQYCVAKPVYIFLNLYVRHLGFLDGVRGFLWSFFSSLHPLIAYFKYVTNKLEHARDL